MFSYARSEQCDLGPIYTIKNTQRIRIYPGELKFHRIQDDYMANMPVHMSANTKPIQICPVML